MYYLEIATAGLADWVFELANLYTSLLEIIVRLGFSGILAAPNGTARIGILLRRLS